MALHNDLRNFICNMVRGLRPLTLVITGPTAQCYITSYGPTALFNRAYGAKGPWPYTHIRYGPAAHNLV